MACRPEEDDSKAQSMLDKHYRPEEVEQRIYEKWESAGAFAAGSNADPGSKPYCIVIPPPNVTGSLHMGHALNNTLQDVLVRFERMRGRDVLWQPGMDHAGIATQMVVERELEKSQESRRRIGREEFVKRVWAWKEESGGTIIDQLRRLGASCDWSRERFTMDEGLSRAVRKVFVELYRQGLIYKDKRLVNWDTKFLTAISDLEVEQEEVQGKLWHFRYPVDGADSRYIVVATTRPETMLGDTAVAVHPDDERYKDLHGKHVVLPLVGRRIPIVMDEHADPEQGSGAVKITPAHDFNDFEVGRRHDLPMINVLDEEGRLFLQGNSDFMEGADGDTVASTVRRLHGLDRYDAREEIVEMLRGHDLVETIEEHEHTLPYGDRSGTVIEPLLTDQWYVDAQTLAKPAIEAVERGETVFVPKNWEKIYFEWMRNIQPWCISRQLWWGHRIPAWYGPDGTIFVDESEEGAYGQARSHYETEDVTLVQDEDVLDTWFSSGLWPFSTLGWPDATPELDRYYKTDVLVTAFDIIFFWVARMMMMGLHFMNEVPFHTVYIHALVRDAKGQKMSKSKGNVIDPLELIGKFGADALRFTLSAMAAQGRDIKLSESRVEGYRNFNTKLWNAARFSEMNGCAINADFDPHDCSEIVNRWIGGELARTHQRVTDALEAFKFNEAAQAIYHFTWHVFCDWYLELVKPQLASDDGQTGAETRAMVAWVLDQLLILLHPFAPFITEELWSRLGQREKMLIHAQWPRDLGNLIDLEAEEEIDWIIRLVTGVRSVRAEMNVPAGARIPLALVGAHPASSDRLARFNDLILRLARLERAETVGHSPDGAVQLVLDEAIVALPIADVVDLEQERARLTRELEKIAGEIDKLDRKLGNEQFISRAPQHVIEEQRERRDEQRQIRTRLEGALERLKDVV